MNGYALAFLPAVFFAPAAEPAFFRAPVAADAFAPVFRAPALAAPAFSAWAVFFDGGAAGPPSATRAILSGRSATRTVRCAVRFTIRNARPIGAGRTLLSDGPWFA